LLAAGEFYANNQYRIIMNELSKLLIRTLRTLFLAAVLMFGGIFASYAADLQMFSNAKLINNPANDGDSFLVEANGKSFRVRLYFVDCPETSISSESDARRVREQTRYFGLSRAARTIHFGNEAKIFVERILAKPFTVHTAFASALGRSAKGRVYGFITTTVGDDLASLLVKNGLARTHGIGRKTPNSIPRNEMIERLRDLETSAMLKHIGIWSESDPDRIAKFRAEQRSEDQELKNLQSQVKKAKSPQDSLDLNTATEKELQSIKGVGPVLAKRIIAGRPYKIVGDLLKVKGIGPNKLEKIRPYVVVGKE
jgi:competence ComEA-like helix-hairpin-helix protein